MTITYRYIYHIFSQKSAADQRIYYTFYYTYLLQCRPIFFDDENYQLYKVNHNFKKSEYYKNTKKK